MKTQFFYLRSMTSKGHWRSQKVILKFKNHLSSIYFLFIAQSFKTFQKFQPIFHKIKYDQKGYPRSYKTIFMPNHSCTCVYGHLFEC